MAQTCVLGSLAIVHGILDNDEKHARLSLDASMQLARIVRELKDFNPRKMPILVIVSWSLLRLVWVTHWWVWKFLT